MIAQRAFAGQAATKRRMGVQQALEWAFGRECASLDLGVVNPDEGPRPSSGAEYVIWQRFMLGATVDQGGPAWGGSAPHHDAEVIAAFVANLHESVGGRAMSVRIAELARAGTTPDWMPGAQQRCVPKAWKRENQHGQLAKTAVIGQQAIVTRGRTVEQPILWCPVMYTPSSRQIDAARRAYLNWWGALLDLSTNLRGCDMLSEIEVTNVMPPMEPWRKVG